MPCLRVRRLHSRHPLLYRTTTGFRRKIRTQYRMSPGSLPGPGISRRRRAGRRCTRPTTGKWLRAGTRGSKPGPPSTASFHKCHGGLAAAARCSTQRTVVPWPRVNRGKIHIPVILFRKRGVDSFIFLIFTTRVDRNFEQKEQIPPPGERPESTGSKKG